MGSGGVAWVSWQEGILATSPNAVVYRARMYVYMQNKRARIVDHGFRATTAILRELD